MRLLSVIESFLYSSPTKEEYLYFQSHFPNSVSLDTDFLFSLHKELEKRIQKEQGERGLKIIKESFPYLEKDYLNKVKIN